MARFFYRVKNKQNKISQGYIEALSVPDAAEKLIKKGYIIKILYNTWILG